MNRRGELFEDFLANAGLSLENNSEPTWARNNISGINDYICTREIENGEFKVLEEDSLTEHRMLEFKTDKNGDCRTEMYIGTRLNHKKLEEQIKNLNIDQRPVFTGNDSVDKFVCDLTASLQDAIDTSSEPNSRRRGIVAWWNEKLESLKKHLNRINRED